MDFELSEEQQAVRDAAGELLAGMGSVARARAAMAEGIGGVGGAVDADLWAAVVAQGWPALATAEDAGGIGLGWVEAAAVLEQVGAHVAPVPVLGQLVALEVLADTEWGPALLDGTRIAAVAHAPEVVVPFAPAADVVVVPLDGRLRAVDLSGRPITAEPAMDQTRPVGWVRAVDLADRPGLDLGGSDVVERFEQVGAVAYAAELLGLAQRALDLTVAYAKDRIQFGRPIGSFQAVKHRCADMLVDVEGMRSASYWAAWCVSVDHDEAAVAASVAKSWCTDAATRVMASALQVHGGIGFTWESDVHLYLKRAHLDGLCFGDAATHRARLAQLLRAKVEAGAPVL